MNKQINEISLLHNVSLRRFPHSKRANFQHLTTYLSKESTPNLSPNELKAVVFNKLKKSEMLTSYFESLLHLGSLEEQRFRVNPHSSNQSGDCRQSDVLLDQSQWIFKLNTAQRWQCRPIRNRVSPYWACPFCKFLSLTMIHGWFFSLPYWHSPVTNRMFSIQKVPSLMM